MERIYFLQKENTFPRQLSNPDMFTFNKNATQIQLRREKGGAGVGSIVLYVSTGDFYSSRVGTPLGYELVQGCLVAFVLGWGVRGKSHKWTGL